MVTSNNEKVITELGTLGEQLVAEYLTIIGKKVILSDNIYDPEKDMLVDGEKVEVKTETPYVTRNALTVRANQLEKIMGSYRTYWISVPFKLYGKEDKYGGYIFEMDPKGAEYFRFRKMNQQKNLV